MQPNLETRTSLRRVISHYLENVTTQFWIYARGRMPRIPLHAHLHQELSNIVPLLPFEHIQKAYVSVPIVQRRRLLRALVRNSCKKWHHLHVLGNEWEDVSYDTNVRAILQRVSYYHYADS